MYWVTHFGKVIRSAVRPVKDEEIQALTALLTRHRQLLGMLSAEKNRLPMALGQETQGHQKGQKEFIKR